MKRSLSIILIVLLLSSVISSPVSLLTSSAHLKNRVLENAPHDIFVDSYLPLDRQVRVAIYDEPNTTLPEYATGLGMQFSNEISELKLLLEGAGFEVSNISLNDILNHELRTRNYDVLVVADNYPRENITHLVDEFWLGGGGVLGLNAAFGYLVYAGIIMPEAKGDDVYGLLWDEELWSTHKIIERHPVSKKFQAADTLIEDAHEKKEFYNGPYIDENSVVSPYFDILANQSDGSGYSSLVALDNVMKGGRVVAMAANTTSITNEVGSIIIDAIEWLCPRPKGYILYDHTHEPLFGTDPWDSMSVYPNYYREMRNFLVNNSFCVDKLRPSPQGNLTPSNLAGYDVLISAMPRLNYSASEVSAVTEWVNEGGGLLATGDKSPGDADTATRINYLVSSFDVMLNTTVHDFTFDDPNPSDHPTTERCSTIDIGEPKAYVNISGTAGPVWQNGGDIWIAADEPQSGRLILFGDSNIFQNSLIGNADNQQFLINSANWLTSPSSEILLWVNEPTVSYHTTPVAKALNELGVDYYLTSTDDYFNRSLNAQPWDLVIVDTPWEPLTSPYCEEIAQYIEGGGRVLISNYYMGSTRTHRLWPLLGINYTSEISGFYPMYIWEPGHPLFNNPYDYAANNFTPSAFYGDHGDVFETYDNATALAGLSSSIKLNESLIAYRNDGQTLYNGFLIDEFWGDIDESTYTDNFELWLNEIAFMLRPTMDSPADLQMEAGSSAPNIVWSPQSDRPYEFAIYRNGVEITRGPWDGDEITFITTGSMPYPPNIYVVNCTVWDNSGSKNSDIVIFTVIDTTAPAITAVPSNLEYTEGTTTHFLNWSVDELYPGWFYVYINGTEHENSIWLGGNISTDVGGLDPGVYNITLEVEDDYDNSAASSVILTVSEESSTTTSTTTQTETTTSTTTTSTTPEDGDNTIIFFIIGVAAVVVIVIIMLRRKKS